MPPPAELVARSMSQTTNKIGSIVGIILSVIVVAALMIAILWRSMAIGEREESMVDTFKRVGHRHHESVQVNYLATLSETEMQELRKESGSSGSDAESVSGKSYGGSTLNGSDREDEKDRDWEKERDFEKEPRGDFEKESRQEYEREPRPDYGRDRV
ncbi:hypothetical protein BS50DRAFT_568398 [Corynespora cassiicola Philippines]|uniref:Uncharacterized protein n=1 Tax=Corynespora cassiicola Philippines TaxID=1448308 RepID=A0A2T2P507_CORCC|nr:hypothetical protein BS50DRAFT_568398 [Corynespora cassiicola Philippines]